MRPNVSILFFFLTKVRLRTLPTCFYKNSLVEFLLVLLITFFYFWDEAERFYSNLFAQVKDKNGSNIFFLGGSLVEFLLERGINRKCEK